MKDVRKKIYPAPSRIPSRHDGTVVGSTKSIFGAGFNTPSQRCGIYSHELGIKLKRGTDNEIFKWFLACLLFGKPIQQVVAKRTYFEFKKEGLLTPENILKAGWNKLVKVLDKGHYVRYDFSTATKLLEICRALKEKYGTLSQLLKESKNKKDIKRKLLEFKGIGPVTARIFIRDLKYVQPRKK